MGNEGHYPHNRRSLRLHNRGLGQQVGTQWICLGINGSTDNCTQQKGKERDQM